MLLEWTHSKDYIGIRFDQLDTIDLGLPGKRLLKYQKFCLRGDPEFNNKFKCAIKVSADVNFVIDTGTDTIGSSDNYIPGRIEFILWEEFRSSRTFLCTSFFIRIGNKLSFGRPYYDPPYCNYSPYAIKEDGTTVGSIPNTDYCFFESGARFYLGLEGCYDIVLTGPVGDYPAYEGPVLTRLYNNEEFFNTFPRGIMQFSYYDGRYLEYAKYYSALELTPAQKQILFPEKDWRYYSAPVFGYTSYAYFRVNSFNVTSANGYDTISEACSSGSTIFFNAYSFYPSIQLKWREYNQSISYIGCFEELPYGAIHRLEYTNNIWVSIGLATSDDLCYGNGEPSTINYYLGYIISVPAIKYEQGLPVIDSDNIPILDFEDRILVIARQQWDAKAAFHEALLYRFRYQEDSPGSHYPSFNPPSSCFDIYNNNPVPIIDNIHLLYKALMYYASGWTEAEAVYCLQESVLNCLPEAGQCGQSQVYTYGDEYGWLAYIYIYHPYDIRSSASPFFKMTSIVLESSSYREDGCCEHPDGCYTPSSTACPQGPHYHSVIQHLESTYTSEVMKNSIEIQFVENWWPKVIEYVSSESGFISGSYLMSLYYSFNIYANIKLNADPELEYLFSEIHYGDIPYTAWARFYNFSLAWLRPNEGLSYIFSYISPNIDTSLLMNYIDIINVGSFSEKVISSDPNINCPDTTFAVSSEGLSLVCLYQSPIDLACAPTYDYSPYFAAIVTSFDYNFVLMVPGEFENLKSLPINTANIDIQDCEQLKTEAINTLYSYCSSCSICYVYSEYNSSTDECDIILYFKYN